MNIQDDRTLQEAQTTLSVPEVITAAKAFFARRNTIYAAFAEKEGPNFVSLRGQGGVEVLIAAAPGVAAIAASLHEAAARVEDVEARVRGSAVRWPRDWGESFSDAVLGRVMELLRS